MITQKDVTAFFKNTKESCSFCVFAFDSKTGERIHGGGCFNECYSAFMSLTRILAAGHKAILTDSVGHDYLFEIEMGRDTWITYDELLPYAIKFDPFGNKVKQTKEL